MSYTKGQWKAIHNGNFFEIAVPWDGELEARKYSPAVAYAWDVGEETAEANAHLIAAAPDLLEALRDAEALVVGWAVHHAMQGCSTKEEFAKATDISGWNQVHRDIYRKVKAAISKAEGKL